MNENWGAETWRKPKMDEEDREICSEHGRILDKVDYRSHWLVLVEAKYGGYFILVHHGGGEERIPLGYRKKRLVTVLGSLDSDTRYSLLYDLMTTYKDGEKKGREDVAQTYRKAFVDGRLKKRKLPSQGRVKVWIESQPAGVKRQLPTAKG